MEPDQLLGVEVRHLAALAAIARTRSFSRAGDELGYAQSAVSQQIAALERAVGHKLVERPGGPKPVSLTEAGEVLLRHAASITARLAAAKADLDALAAGEAGVLRVGTFQSAGARLLPLTLARFRAAWPKVDVQLRAEANADELERLVLSGALDLAFADLDGVRPPVVGQEILMDPYVVLVPPGHRLARTTAIELSDLDGEDLIACSISDQCTRRIEHAFSDQRATPKVVYRTDDNIAVQRFVSSGLGCAVVATLAVQEHLPDDKSVVVALGPKHRLNRAIGIVWHGERLRANAAIAFTEVARRVADEELARRGARPMVRTQRKRSAG